MSDLQRRRLRARYYAARTEYQLSARWLTFDGFDPDALCAFDLARVNLETARAEYLACGGLS